ncbi:MAG: endonuclease III [Candidatus Omnitrophica bacterium]|nr:endonuclease III [Candidatus Omnitrophota bacterium]MBU1047440.1 endonuclease III [Candidatus Omnitrophota bacterium]MBU1630317.1 endonuclease III [Candidatus Omnitrophota bacterium]MBU1888803.1 endonuclease III [Candidatus Omnitrophota bacterium]
MSLKTERIEEIIRILRASYPNLKTSLKYKKPFELLVATILSAQCTDVRVNQLTPSLFKKYPNIKNFATIKHEELEKDIYSTGFYRNKAKSIIGTAKKLLKDFNGNVPDNMADLITLPGVARKTANVVLSSAFKKVEGITVDVHVKRLSERLGLSKEKNAEKTEKDLMRIIHKKDWLEISYFLIDHGRAICKARKPLCLQCQIKHLCPSAGKI